jgi:regulator of protease activity HflC (stomatin/prohibitin superfamily)
MILGAGLLVGAAGILIRDLYQVLKPRKPADTLFPKEESHLPDAPAEPFAPRWRPVRTLAWMGTLPLLIALSISVVPSGDGGVRVSQIAGVRPGTLYPGVHLIVPLVEHVELFNIRDHVFTTSLSDDPKKQDALNVQTREGLKVGLAISVRYRLDAGKLAYIEANLPQPLEEELIAPVIGTSFRELAPNYLVREMFSTRREEIRRMAAGQIAARLAADGIAVKEVMLRDIQLPTEYARGLEGLLLKEQENERLNIELEVKLKMVRSAELEAEAQKAREVKEAEAKAEVVVLEAKAQADAMQHTLPLKEKQIQQSRLEAEARKEATVKNAEAMAEAKVIDSKAELEKRKQITDSDEYHIRRVASADAERMKLEAEVLKQNPLLIQKIIAEKLSDKVQIMMVPNDGKFFFANDVLRGAMAEAPPAAH